jgi:hypothetical protein
MRWTHRCLLSLCAVTAACYTAPDVGAEGSVGNALRRTFASDLSAAGFARREACVTRSLTLLLGDPARATRLPRTLAAAGKALAGDAAAMVPAGERVVQAELGRVRAMHLPDVPDLDAAAASRRLADALAELPLVLDLEGRPLGEIDDLAHRTDPNDDRAEAGWLARLGRRLGL